MLNLKEFLLFLHMTDGGLMFDDDEFNEIMKGLKFGKSNPKAKQAPSAQTRQTLRVSKSKNQPSGDNATDLSDWLDRVEKLRKTSGF